MKMTILIVLVFVVGAYAGMIELTDDDPNQFVEFSQCDPDSFASVIFGVRVNPDSGYWQRVYVLNDTIRSIDLGYIRSDINEYGQYIPGVYDGEYWFTVMAVPKDGSPATVPTDTTHVYVSYTRSVGCGGVIHVD